MRCSIAIIIVSLFSCSCAGVKLYKDSDLKSQTGLKVYNSKPFLLVEFNSHNDTPLKSSIVFLPDLTQPTYAKVIRGIGSNDLKINLTDGMLTSYGVTTDSKLPELLTSLTGVTGGVGSLIKDLATARRDSANAVGRRQPSEKPYFILYEVQISESGETILKEVRKEKMEEKL